MAIVPVPTETEATKAGHGHVTGATQAQTQPAASQAAHGEVETLQVVEERARIDKRFVETGRVRVSARTETLDEVLRETLRSDAVDVMRVPINRTIEVGEIAPQVRVEAGVTIIPVLEEVLVVEKRLVLLEEVHVRQTSSDEDVEVPVTLRRQHAIIERVGPDGQVVEATSKETGS